MAVSENVPFTKLGVVIAGLLGTITVAFGGWLGTSVWALTVDQAELHARSSSTERRVDSAVESSRVAVSVAEQHGGEILLIRQAIAEVRAEVNTSRSQLVSLTEASKDSLLVRILQLERRIDELENSE